MKVLNPAFFSYSAPAYLYPHIALFFGATMTDDSPKSADNDTSRFLAKITRSRKPDEASPNIVLELRPVRTSFKLPSLQRPFTMPHGETDRTLGHIEMNQSSPYIIDTFSGEYKPRPLPSVDSLAKALIPPRVNNVYVAPFSFVPEDMLSIRPTMLGGFPLGQDIEAWIKQRNAPVTMDQAETKLANLRQFSLGFLGGAMAEHFARDVAQAFIKAGSKVNKKGELRQKTQRRIDAAKRHAYTNCAKALLNELKDYARPTPLKIAQIVKMFEASGVTLTKEGKLPKRMQRHLDSAIACAAKRPAQKNVMLQCSDIRSKL